MKKLSFVTGNKDKFVFAKHALDKIGVELQQTPFDIDEIQSEDARKIVQDKAHRAFDILKKPLLVSDDSWEIPALNGFPGAYMKFVNQWFEPEDFLNLMRGKKNQNIYLVQNVVYMDGKITKTFVKRVKGTFLQDVDDIKHNFPITKVTTFTKDGVSLAKIRTDEPERLSAETDNVWDDVATWLKGKH